jgi:hypothetical protein
MIIETEIRLDLNDVIKDYLNDVIKDYFLIYRKVNGIMGDNITLNFIVITLDTVKITLP